MNEPVNPAVLHELESLLSGTFNSFLNMFVTDMATRLEAIDRALSAADSKALREAAHSLKGSSLNLGAEELAEKCTRLEDQAVRGELNVASQTVVGLKSDAAAVAAYLRAWSA